MFHTCDALVLACIDFRFHQLLSEPLKSLGITSYDLKCDAGGVKYLISQDKAAVRDWILENMAISKRLHGIKQVVLINHYDCGAYGGNAAWGSDAEQSSFQAEQLRKAKNLVAGKFPDLKIITLFALFMEGRLELKEI